MSRGFKVAIVFFSKFVDWVLHFRCYVCMFRFTACQDLVTSRFCCKDYEQFDIVGIHVHRVTRVVNRSLKIRFDDALRSYLDDDETYLPSAKLVLS